MVTIRIKERRGKKIIHLDIYHKGKRKFINTHLEITGNKKIDSALMQKAEELKAKKILELAQNNFEIHIGLKNDDFSMYALKECELNPSYSKRNNFYKHLLAFSNHKAVKFSDINEEWWKKFKEYFIARGSAQNTIQNYFVILKAIINKAVNQGLIPNNPLRLVKEKRIRTNKSYLELNELLLLSQTACRKEMVKNAFLFSCYTGLRVSDIRSLKYKDIVNNVITIYQYKTKEPVVIPLNETSLSLIGAKGDDELVFPLNYSQATVNNELKLWANASGIKKNISFHTARHTFATLLLTYDVDIKTVSNLLGHTAVKTTEIYAKIIDEKRKKAVDKLPKLI